jgi:DNA-binding CsgD family transcriptional regulator
LRFCWLKANCLEVGCLFGSENSIRFHLRNACSTLGFSGRVQAISAARSMALLD